MTITPIAAAWINRAAGATVTSTTAAALMPVSLLQQEDTRRVWRGAGGAGVLESVYFDFLSTQSDIQQVSLIYTNLAAVDATRCRLSVADPTCVVNTYDSNSAAGRVNPDYRALHFLVTPALPPRYGRVDLTRAAGSPEAGFLHAGPYTAFTDNFGFSTRRKWVDLSVHKPTRGGQTRIIPGSKYRNWEIDVPLISDTQRWSLVEAMDVANGIQTPVILFTNPASADLGRDSIYGLFETLDPVAFIPPVDASGNHSVTRTYPINERL